MKYTYKVVVEGLDKSSIYLKFCFDRVIYNGSVYFRSDNNPPEILSALNSVDGIMPCSGNFSGSGLLLLEGNELTARIMAVEAKQIPKIANRIVKRIQRRFAKGEPRQRVKREKLLADIEKLNKRIF